MFASRPRAFFPIIHSPPNARSAKAPGKGKWLVGGGLAAAFAATLCSASEPPADLYPSPYTRRVKMQVLRNAADPLGEWRTETVNIATAYRKAFGESPPHRARLAIMTDSDDTGQRTEAAMDYIRLSGRPPPGADRQRGIMSGPVRNNIDHDKYAEYAAKHP